MGSGRSVGDTAALSFYPQRTLGAWVTVEQFLPTKNDLLPQRELCGTTDKPENNMHVYLGMNSRLDEIQQQSFWSLMPSPTQRLAQRRRDIARHIERISLLRCG